MPMPSSTKALPRSRKTGGTGTSTFSFTGVLTNTGTIEADSGTLDLEPTSFAQLSSGGLTGGTWNALDRPPLPGNFPSGTTITDNAATIALGGSGARRSPRRCPGWPPAAAA